MHGNGDVHDAGYDSVIQIPDCMPCLDRCSHDVMYAVMHVVKDAHHTLRPEYNLATLQMLDIAARNFGAGHLNTLRAMRSLGNGLVGADKSDEALPLMRLSAEWFCRTFGANHEEAIQASRGLATCPGPSVQGHGRPAATGSGASSGAARRRPR